MCRVLSVPTGQDGLFTSQGAADYLHVSPRTLIRWRNARMIPFLRLGRLIRYRRSDLERALNRRVVQEVF